MPYVPTIRTILWLNMFIPQVSANPVRSRDCGGWCESVGSEKITMSKRSRGAVKRSPVPEETVPAKRAAEPEPEPDCPLCFQTPASLFSSLLSPLSPERFFSEHWEQKPVHLRRDDPGVAAYYRALFSLSDLPGVCARGLEYCRDVNVVRCVDGKKKVLNKTGRVKFEALNRLITQNKATVQFHQPQRFKEQLWRIQEKLESFFGALVGSNVYMTPADSQGLPAHYDDVEVFILQLEGQKHWRLYSPTVPLASDYSLVPEEQLGGPTHDILLQEGDLLYFPRGTIHQANTLPGEHSTHLTLSTYQRMSWSDLLLDVLPGFLSESSRTELCLRRGMPKTTLLRSCDDSVLRSQMAAHLRLLADRLETHTDKTHLSSASLKRDFIMNRLPPHCPEEELVPVGKLPQLQDTVCLTFREHMVITVEPTHRTTDEAPEMAVFVLHSLRNQRSQHMMSEGPEDEEGPHVSSGLHFPLSHLGALQQLQQEEHLCVSDLLLPGPEEQLGLVLALWSESLLKTLRTTGDLLPQVKEGNTEEPNQDHSLAPQESSPSRVQESGPQESSPQESSPQESSPSRVWPSRVWPLKSLAPQESGPSRVWPLKSLAPQESGPQESGPQESSPQESGPSRVWPLNSLECAGGAGLIVVLCVGSTVMTMCSLKGLHFPLSHLGALQQLQQEEHLCVSDLLLPGPEEQLGLVLALWSESLLKTLSCSSLLPISSQSLLICCSSRLSPRSSLLLASVFAHLCCSSHLSLLISSQSLLISVPISFQSLLFSAAHLVSVPALLCCSSCLSPRSSLLLISSQSSFISAAHLVSVPCSSLLLISSQSSLISAAHLVSVLVNLCCSSRLSPLLFSAAHLVSVLAHLCCSSRLSPLLFSAAHLVSVLAHLCCSSRLSPRSSLLLISS
ncbi:hypothetical protein WMY93_015689 [Mugilogobius chulae]|uniref:Bifunctional lysine-specific demethylase and histidyl-hydroxylase n=1 Tax=Mugilogobius chulae TaxID=88201 RepID=A0AAW0NRV9_9GOBI